MPGRVLSRVEQGEVLYNRLLDVYGQQQEKNDKTKKQPTARKEIKLTFNLKKTRFIIIFKYVVMCTNANLFYTDIIWFKVQTFRHSSWQLNTSPMHDAQLTTALPLKLQLLYTLTPTYPHLFLQNHTHNQKSYIWPISLKHNAIKRGPFSSSITSSWPHLQFYCTATLLSYSQPGNTLANNQVNIKSPEVEKT